MIPEHFSMPIDLLKFSDGRMRIDLDRCYLSFTSQALKVLAACRARGQDYYPTHGFRSFVEQDRIYSQGRTTPGQVVTKARGGQSAHNFGLAWDVCADGDQSKVGLQANWEVKRYKILGEETLKAGLVWGGFFGDMPHIQWPGFVNGEQLKKLREIWTNCPDHATDTQKLNSVWMYLDALSGAHP